MGNRHAAGFFGIVREIRLCEHVRVVADDFDRALVRADRAVRAEAPEFAGDMLRFPRLFDRDARERKFRHVIDDAERETVFRFVFRQIAVRRQNIFRQYVFGAQAVPTADYADRATRVRDRRRHVQKQRLTERARLFGAIQHRDFFD